MLKCLKCERELTLTETLLVLDDNRVICLDCFRNLKDGEEL